MLQILLRMRFLGIQKYISCFLLISISLVYSAAPKFYPGEILSSNKLNEVVSFLDSNNNGLNSADELLGSWKCTQFQFSDFCLQTGAYNLHSSGMYGTLTDVLTFSKQNGNYFYSSQQYTQSGCFGANGPEVRVAESGKFITVEGVLVTKPTVPNKGSFFFFDTRKKSNNKFTASLNGLLISCNRLTKTPNHPTDLEATANEMSVSLKWKDNSEDEIGYIVFRKQGLKGRFTQVAELEANKINHMDTLPSAATYWYRVAAKNENGNSFGSNVVLVDASVSSTPVSSSTTSSPGF